MQVNDQEITQDEAKEITGGNLWGILRDCVLAVACAADWVYDVTDDFKNNGSRTIF